MKLKRPRTKFILTRRCVFCDGHMTTVTEQEFKKATLYFVRCTKPSCMATGPIRDTRNGAIKKWNLAREKTTNVKTLKAKS